MKFLSALRSKETTFGNPQNFKGTILKRGKSPEDLGLVRDFCITLYLTGSVIRDLILRQQIVPFEPNSEKEVKIGDFEFSTGIAV